MTPRIRTVTSGFFESLIKSHSSSVRMPLFGSFHQRSKSHSPSLSLKEFNKDEVAEYVDIVYNSANNTLILLDNLLVWAVSQNKEKHFKPVKINLYELLREEIENLKTLANQKQIRLSHLIKPDLNVTADLQMVKTILRNLISNAIKYTNINGEITINAS